MIQKRGKTFIRVLVAPLFIFLFALAGHYLSNHHPPQWYQHHVYYAKALLEGTLDVSQTGMPEFYHDYVSVDGAKYLPFPIAPALLILPFVAVFGVKFSQIYFSMFLGAINVVLLWYLFKLLKISKKTVFLLLPFFAFGTAHFYAATTGTVWYYNHVVGVFFLLLALIFLFRNSSPILPAFFLGFAFLSREPLILSAPFFAYWILRQDNKKVFTKETLLNKKALFKMALFCVMLFFFVFFFFYYNFARFGDFFNTGYEFVYASYVSGGMRYSFYRNWYPESSHFGLFDLRNIPLHLYTLFLMLPEYLSKWPFFRPSPYGMSLLFTSPAFIFSLLMRKKKELAITSWIAVGLISIPLILHFTQGWVQFGYRFLLDFVPFLMILAALGFEDRQSKFSTWLKVLLVIISILVGFWGRYWATSLGW